MLKNMLFLIILLITVNQASATSTISCHCFQDRAFDPQFPERVDPYLLATTRNSFMAAVFDLPRKTIVSARMTGTDETELWLGNYLANATGWSLDDLTAEHAGESTWLALYQKHLSGHPLPDAIHSDRQLAIAVVDRLVIEQLRPPSAQIVDLRAAGADNAEVILATLLARWTSRTSSTIYAAVKQGSTSWGRELHATGRQAQQMETIIRHELSARPAD